MTLQHLDTVIAFAVVMLAVSLLITIFTQAMSSLFAQRGGNLRWGVQVLLRTINPSLGDSAGNLAQQILTHPIISDSIFSRLARVKYLGTLTRRWRLASAIRVEELLRILPEVANLPDAPDTAKNAIAQLVQHADPAAAYTIQAAFQTLRSLAPQQTEEAREAMQQMASAAQSSAVNLKTSVENWFNSAMDRVSQRFALQMRMWTVLFSLLVAFAVHLDAINLYTRLSSDAELRAKLVGSADALVKQAGNIIPAQGSAPKTEPSSVPQLYSEQMKALQAQAPSVAKLGTPPEFKSRDEGSQWLRDGMKGDPQAEQLVSKYQELVDAGLKSNEDKLLDQSADIRNLLAQSGFQLIPDPYPQPWYEPWNTFTAREFWGTMAAAGFLSLGAPFWFNALKTLSSLRPIVANKEQAEQQHN